MDQSQQPKTRALVKPMDEVRNNLTKLEPQFKAALPSHVSVDKFMRVVTTAIASNKDLIEADRTSLFAASMKSAQDGLLPDGREAALVTYGKNVVYMPMIAGILKKIRNSGELASITSQVVFDQDTFEYWVDQDGEHVNHRPLMFGNRGKEIGVYALAKTKDGAVYIEVLSVDQVAAIQNMSKGKVGPWNGPFKHEMWRKSALRRLSKRLPMSTDLIGTIEADDELYQAPTVSEDTEPKKRTSRIAKLVGTEEAALSDVSPSIPEPPVINRSLDPRPEPPQNPNFDDEIPL